MGPIAEPREVALQTLLEVMPEREVRARCRRVVRGLTDDSRRVTAGGCFVAVRGIRADGHRFIPQAVERGARAVVAEPPDPLPGEAVGRILVPDTRRALPRLADAYYGHPSRALTVVGITGTNGKTTTSYLSEALLRARGLDTGVIGTIQYVVRGEAREAGQTTPEAIELQGLLAEMVAAGVGGVAMEVSSMPSRSTGWTASPSTWPCSRTSPRTISTSTGRCRGTPPRRAGCSSSSCRRGGKRRATAVLNADDPWGRNGRRPSRAGPHVRARAGPRDPAAPARVGARGHPAPGTSPAGTVRLVSPLIGEHNVMNLLGAVGVGVALGPRPAARSPRRSAR